MNSSMDQMINYRKRVRTSSAGEIAHLGPGHTELESQCLTFGRAHLPVSFLVTLRPNCGGASQQQTSATEQTSHVPSVMTSCSSLPAPVVLARMEPTQRPTWSNEARSAMS